MRGELVKGAAGGQLSRYREQSVGGSETGRVVVQLWNSAKGSCRFLPSARSLWKHLLLLFWGQGFKMNFPFLTLLNLAVSAFWDVLTPFGYPCFPSTCST